MERESTLSNHQIRLHNAWTIGATGPCDAAPPLHERPEAGQQIRYERGFGLPTGLFPGDEVHLSVRLDRGSGTLWLNGVKLGTIDSTGPHSYPVADRLEPRNVLGFDLAYDSGFEIVGQTGGSAGPSMDVTPSRKSGRFPGEIMLEIRPRDPR